MKTIKNNLLPIIAIFLAWACYEPVTDFELETYDKKITVYGAFNTSDSLKVNLTKSFSLNEKEKYSPILNANVWIESNGTFVDSISETGNGWYINNKNNLNENAQYTLKAYHKNYGVALCDFKMPPKTEILEYDVTIEEKIFSYGDRIKVLQIELKFDDDAESEDYYMVQAEENIYITSYWDYKEDTILYDTILSSAPAYFYSDNIYVEVISDYGYYYENSIDGEIGGNKMYFSDKLINGKKSNSLRLQFTIFYDSFRSGSDYELNIKLTKVNDDYFKYIRKMVKVQSSGEDFLGEAVSAYNPVQNGFGLVYGYSSTEIKIDSSQIPEIYYEDNFDEYDY